MNNWIKEVQQLKQYLYVDENDLLREKCTSPEYLEALIKRGERILWEYAEEDRPIILGHLGNLYRIKGDLQVALPYLERFKDYALASGNEDYAILGLLRFAEALKYDRQYEAALAYFEEALERGRLVGITKYENMVWQHLGKCYVEMGTMRRAENCFLKALLLRKQMGDEHLLKATERALKFIMNIKK